MQFAACKGLSRRSILMLACTFSLSVSAVEIVDYSSGAGDMGGGASSGGGSGGDIGGDMGGGMGGMGGIPVSCSGCERATKNANYEAANAINDGIRNQTEAMVNAMDYVMRVEQAVINTRAKAEHKLANAYQMQPELGAKPRPACGQYAAASIRKAVEATSPAVKAAVNQKFAHWNNRGRDLEPGEPQTEYDVKKILQIMDEPEFDGAETVMSEEAIDPKEPEKVQELLEKHMQTLNPFPITQPAAEEVERIKAHGTPTQKEKLARGVVMNERLQIPQQIFSESINKRLRKIKTADLKYMLDELKLDKNQELPETISEYELDELLATYRVKSPAWFISVLANPSSEAARKDALLIQAETLYQLWQINSELRKMNRLNAASAIREISQSDLQSR